MKTIITIAFSLLLTILFCSTSLAAISGTDSSGSYSFDAENKQEGSKSKNPASKGTVTKKGEGSGSKAPPHKKPGYMHGKKEGSGHKSYAPSRKGYTHKGGQKEGSAGRKYSHGSPHSSHQASGHGRAHQSGKSPFEHVLCFTKKLGLTEGQVEKIKGHEFEFKKMKIQTTADHAIAHMELDRLVHSGSIDEAAMRAIADRIIEIKSKKIRAMVEAKIVLLNILTPEQRQKVNQIHSKK